ncbi:kinase-like domain-containing protein [Thermothelomyces heterothallicus CBS 202.75]|uniref:kinase-like domain-containing protein n=1 Tax=Thermothelomyces heterothallicus CBS 202.75 TaxID=1149848 RepID=UPI0037447622
MARNVNSSTLFHLVPDNDAAREALLHPDNSRFVSNTHTELQGLEVGFHVPSVPKGRVITRVGRDADLILRGRTVSAVHVAFEIHPETLVVLLSVRSKHSSSVTISSDFSEAKQKIQGDCVLVYGTSYRISIVSYNFLLIWRDLGSVEALRQLAIEGYQISLQRIQTIRSRDLPTDGDSSELHSWHNTRLHTARRILFREAEGAPRELIGEGTFGAVYRAVDLESGNPFAVKVVKLHAYGARYVEQARAAVHREMKTLEYLKHKHIVECLGTAKFDSNQPEIFMPLRPGNLRVLAQNKDRRCTDDSLCMQVLEQMLSALDYLADRGYCHRDIKPENILYYEHAEQGTYTFQLADFGLANHQANAVTVCGTTFYQAPELLRDYGPAGIQSPKMDIWSLFCTILDVHPKFNFPPWNAKSYHDVLVAVRAAVPLIPKLADMAREDPAQRASAAQLLVAHFGGRGLTTRKSAIPPLPSQPPAYRGQAPPANLGGPPAANARSPSPRPPPQKAPKAPPLIVYDSRHRRQRGKEPAVGPSNLFEVARAQNPRPPQPMMMMAPRQDGGVRKSRAVPAGSPIQSQRMVDALDTELLSAAYAGRA